MELGTAINKIVRPRKIARAFPELNRLVDIAHPTFNFGS
jgi:hypothetical protein